MRFSRIWLKYLGDLALAHIHSGIFLEFCYCFTLEMKHLFPVQKTNIKKPI